MPRITDIELLSDLTATSRCDEGFLRLKRYTARNRRDDGSASSEHRIDVIDRPALDAVAVCAYARGPRGIEVLTRAGLRPAALFRRGKATVVPEPEYLLVEEIVAGVIEPGEHGLAAMQRRGADELHEEAGLLVDPSRLEPLGAAVFMLPGIASEKIHLLAVEVPPPQSTEPRPAPEHGDGSPLEEGAMLRWRLLPDAIDACEAGEIEDAKTELAFRRLAARIA
jgi:ADP-ribose pyrophosphatase